MKLVVFAHTPPPHHGQSYMVKLMLDGFGGDCRDTNTNSQKANPHNIACYHVNARFSDDLEDIGRFQFKKILLLFRYCLTAIWYRFRYRADTLYYIPAPGKPSAVFRDWIVMLFCRPFFRNIIFHWHAAGLANWLDTSVSGWKRFLTIGLLKKPTLSVILARFNRNDAATFLSQETRLVPNGIPDPCPSFEQTVLGHRKSRAVLHRTLFSRNQFSADDSSTMDTKAQFFNVLYLAHCTKEKGLFDTLNAVARANQILEEANSLVRIKLTVAGSFVSVDDRIAFEMRIQKPDLKISSVAANAARSQDNEIPAVLYKNFVNGVEKNRLFEESDCFCFPTYHYAESFGLVLVEAMAYGLKIVTSQWRSIPEVMPPNFGFLVQPKDVAGIAKALLTQIQSDYDPQMRQHFLDNFTLEKHLENLSAAFHTIE